LTCISAYAILFSNLSAYSLCLSRNYLHKNYFCHAIARPMHLHPLLLCSLVTISNLLQNRCAPTLQIKALEEELCAIPLEYHATCLHSKLAIRMSKDIVTTSLFFKVSTPLSTMGELHLSNFWTFWTLFPTKINNCKNSLNKCRICSCTRIIII